MIEQLLTLIGALASVLGILWAVKSPLFKRDITSNDEVIKAETKLEAAKKESNEKANNYNALKREHDELVQRLLRNRTVTPPSQPTSKPNSTRDGDTD
jgi:hypothetical protein